MTYKLEVSDLSKSFRGRKVVDAVSLCVHGGEIVGLLGSNGAGKTTVFSMLIGLLKADRGQIRMNGKDISMDFMHKRARHGIGYLPQEASVFRKLSVRDNIRVGLESRDDLDTQEKESELERLLDEFHLQGVRSSLGLSLSGGERRRTEIARSLAGKPVFLLLDEPFASVDPISIADIRKMLIRLREQGIGLLITDHNVRETLCTCDRAYIMCNGQMIADGSPEDVMRHEKVRQVYLGDDFTI